MYIYKYIHICSYVRFQSNIIHRYYSAHKLENQIPIPIQPFSSYATNSSYLTVVSSSFENLSTLYNFYMCIETLLGKITRI